MIGRRDHGVCAGCGCDTLKLLRVLRHVEKLLSYSLARSVWVDLGFHGTYRRCGDRWQMDHVRPIAEGGGKCGLENLQTLCTPCHRAKTSALCRELALRRREQQQQRELQENRMNIGAAFPSKYLKAANIPEDRPVQVRIYRVEQEDVSGKGAAKEVKPVLYFVGKEKGMVLNKTNAQAIANAYGQETTEWRGKPVEIYVGETQYAGDVVACLRIRIPKVSAGNSAGARPAPAAREAVTSPVSDDKEFNEADIPF
jgi:hypothetical protein